MATELELKLAVGDLHLLDCILCSPDVRSRMHGDFTYLQTESTYFDTPDGKLAARHWALRLRKLAGKSVVTIKTPGEGLARGEWETEAEYLEDAVPRLVKDGAPAELADILQSGVLAESGRGEKAQTVRENVLYYNVDKAVKPIVAYGNTLYGRSSMKQTAAYLDDNDLMLVAGVNGAFFDMHNGVPYGLVVTEGVLRSSGNIQSVGFLDDGSAIIGQPGLKVTMETPDGAKTEIFYNKALSKNNGIGLYSRDYDTATKGSVDGYHVLLEPVRGSGKELLLNDSITLEVIGTLAGKASCGIPEDGFVLSIGEKTIYASALDQMEALETGVELKGTEVKSLRLEGCAVRLRRRRPAGGKRACLRRFYAGQGG